MWDYDKLFAEGNIVGLKNLQENKVFAKEVHKKKHWKELGHVNWAFYFNNDLSFVNVSNFDFEIQYIIRLDKHGNVAEKLFDRERDMRKPMPKLETGMFVKVIDKETHRLLLGFVYKEDNRVIYQCGTYDHIYNIIDGEFYDIAEIFSSEATSYSDCYDYNKIWYNPKYQVYIN